MLIINAMTIYKYICDSDTYHSLILDKSETYNLFDQFNGTSIIKSWISVTVHIYRTKLAGDFPHLTSHVPVFSQRAVDVLSPLLEGNVEVLPIECPDYKKKRFFAIHVLELLDCLDYLRSTITRFPSGGIMFIDRYVFKPDIVQDKHIFRILEAPLKGVFVSQKFRDIVEENIGINTKL